MNQIIIIKKWKKKHKKWEWRGNEEGTNTDRRGGKTLLNSIEFNTWMNFPRKTLGKWMNECIWHFLNLIIEEKKTQKWKKTFAKPKENNWKWKKVGKTKEIVNWSKKKRKTFQKNKNKKKNALKIYFISVKYNKFSCWY